LHQQQKSTIRTLPTEVVNTVRALFLLGENQIFTATNGGCIHKDIIQDSIKALGPLESIHKNITSKLEHKPLLEKYPNPLFHNYQDKLKNLKKGAKT
jgi:hypothetical protein